MQRENADTALHGSLLSVPHDPIESIRLFDLKTVSGVVLLSIVYFADVMWRSSRKPFWFDELFTVYLCRLPSMKSTWTAVQHGADFNPPLFYLFTRISEKLFGEGPIATRLPEMLGVWLFCFCLFVFVGRRLGRLPGLIAAAFPLLTLAFHYAYEARPHGITLGWCGLALVCWQRVVEEKSGRILWNAAFLLVMLGSMLTHVYAVYLIVPFALAEAYGFLAKRKLHWGIVAGLIVPLAIVVPIFLPMVRTYKGIMPAMPSGGRTLLTGLLDFASNTLGTSVFALLFFLVIFCCGVLFSKRFVALAPEREQSPVLRLEVVLAICFLTLPLFGILGINVSHAGFFYRYFLAALAGVAILLAYGSAWLRPRICGQLVAIFMLLLICGDLALVAGNVARGKADDLVEPSGKLNFATAPNRVMELDEPLQRLKPDLPLLDIDHFKYIYLYYYAPAALVQRMYFGAPTSTDTFSRSYRALKDWAHVDFRQTDFASFFATHDHFYVYVGREVNTGECGTCVTDFLRAGYRIIGEMETRDSILYEYQR